MIRLPTYWGITVVAGLFNAGIWGTVTLLVLPTVWAVVVSGLVFVVTFWVLSLMQSLERHESSQPRRVGVPSQMGDRMDLLIH